MLHWAVVFFVIAIVAGVLGFGGFVAGTALMAAKLCFGLFVVLFLLSLVIGRGPRLPPNDPVGPYGY